MLRKNRYLFGDDTLTIAQIWQRLCPDSTEYRFLVPEGWGKNLALDAEITSSHPASADGLKMLIDNDGFTAWTSAKGDTLPVLALRWKSPVRFNRLIVFNLYTQSRGTACGCNAAKMVVLEIPHPKNPDSIIAAYELNLPEPTEACFLSSDRKGQVCFYIPSAKPVILEFPEINTDIIRIRVKQTCWLDPAYEYFSEELDCSLSEIMLFLAR
ncbi:MAG: hypothetical protein ABIK47_06875 [candidate division WOR-3 bacterium]